MTTTEPIVAVPRTHSRALLLDVDVAQRTPDVAASRASTSVLVLVRVFTEPVGQLLLDLPADGMSSAELAEAIFAELGPSISSRIVAAGGDQLTHLPADGVTVPSVPPYLVRRAEVVHQAPPITVVICTRDRAGSLSLSLDSVLAQEYPRFRVMVVDNAPRDDATAAVVRQAARRGDVDYLVEPRPGLSRARNAAVAAAPGEILAYLDDDAIADPHWLAEIARGFADVPEADSVSGSILPAELETDAQLWFEQFGGHSKGRGFTQAVFSPATAHRQHPLYPLPPFGAGGNMAFRPGVVDSFGGFDEALGAGTPAMGSEDTHAFMHILRRGGTVVYQPSALVRHYSRRDVEGLRRQLYGYGMGLTAAYTSLVVNHPTTLVPLLRLAPTALRDLFSPASARVEGLRADFPRDLLAENRRGMLRGPLAYLRGRRGLRREEAGR